MPAFLKKPFDLIPYPDDPWVPVVAGMPDKVETGWINVERQITHPQIIHETAILADYFRNGRYQICFF